MRCYAAKGMSNPDGWAIRPGSRGGAAEYSLARRTALGFLVREQRFHKAIDVKQRQIVRLLAQPDVFHRQLELLTDRNHHSAFGGAVELGTRRPPRIPWLG
jgi:hypothetical protein